MRSALVAYDVVHYWAYVVGEIGVHDYHEVAGAKVEAMYVCSPA